MEDKTTPALTTRAAHPLQQLGGIALAGPGAISVVGELSDKLNLSDILTRITVNFKAVSSAFWLQIEAWTDVQLPIDPPGLTMICLLVAPVFFQKYTLAEQRDGRLLITISLGFTYLLMLYLMPDLTVVQLGALSVFYLAWVYVFSHVKDDTSRFDGMTRGALSTAMCLFVLNYFSIDPFYLLDDLFGAGPPVRGEFRTLDFLPMGAVIMITVRKICLGSPGPLYIATLAAGVICLDKLATSIKPALESWLTSIGA